MLKKIAHFVKKHQFLSFSIFAIGLAIIAQAILMLLADTTQEVGDFYVVHTAPSTGQRQTFDTFENVSFTFSQAVDLDSVSITISPPIEYRTTTDPQDPNTLVVTPLESGWRQGTRYNLTITSASSREGENLVQPYLFTYHNIPPDLRENDIAY